MAIINWKWAFYAENMPFETSANGKLLFGARTIADLGDSDNITTSHLAEAIQSRRLLATG